jgi:hypothetical protein
MPSSGLREFANRVASDPTYIASVIRRYCELELLTEAQLATRLGITLDLLNRLKLCKVPDPSADSFADRIRAISDFTLADETTLANVIRHLQAVDALASTSCEWALPAAARDRAEPKESQGEENEKE